MPIGGKLVLKGGETIGGVKKKKKKTSKKKSAAEDDAQGSAGEAKSKADYKYEKEFVFEEERRAVGKVKNTPWGSSYSAPPEILHGYDRKVTGVNAQERLDMRCATKADKFCK